MNFKVLVEPSGKSFDVEEGETLLDAALRHGLSFPYGCRDGACGACKGKVISGRINYGKYSSKALSEPEKLAGMALFCKTEPKSDLHIEVQEVSRIEGIKIKNLPCRIENIQRIAHDIILLHLKLPANQRLQFYAGQYIQFLLKDGRRRSFSIANPPHMDDLIELHIRYVEGGNFTDFIFYEAKPKMVMRIEGPFGNFYLRENSPRPIILIAGGTGFAPLKSFIEHAFYIELNYPIYLYWGVRAKRDLYMDSLARLWEEQYTNFHYIPVLSEPLDEDQWTGRTGLVTNAVLGDFEHLGEFDIYASGPPTMVYAGRDAFVAKGLPENQYFSDAFEFQAPKPNLDL